MSELRFPVAATDEDVAAVTAVLRARSSGTRPEDAYSRWRRTRLAALRTSADEPDRHPRGCR